MNVQSKNDNIKTTTSEQFHLMIAHKQIVYMIICHRLVHSMIDLMKAPKKVRLMKTCRGGESYDIKCKKA